MRGDVGVQVTGQVKGCFGSGEMTGEGMLEFR